MTAKLDDAYQMACQMAHLDDQEDQVKQIAGLHKTVGKLRISQCQKNQEIKELKQRVAGLETMLSKSEALVKTSQNDASQTLMRNNYLERQMDDVYMERAHLLALLATGSNAIFQKDKKAPVGFQDVLLMKLPFSEKQGGWHLTPGQKSIFQGLVQTVPDEMESLYDGHTTEEKYERIRAAVKSAKNTFQLDGEGGTWESDLEAVIRTKKNG